MRSARSKGKKDPAYLEWVRSLPCIICVGLDTLQRVLLFGFKYSSRVESAHVGLRGLGQKCSDRDTIPLCAEHHRTGEHAHHVLGKRFWAHHRIDRDALVAELNKQYDSIQQRRTA